MYCLGQVKRERVNSETRASTMFTMSDIQVVHKDPGKRTFQCSHEMCMQMFFTTTVESQ